MLTITKLLTSISTDVVKSSSLVTKPVLIIKTRGIYMKAIFAVTALAAAISGQALAADTEATTTFNGAMQYDFTVDMAAETKDVELQKGDDANDGGSYGIYMDVKVVNGPFSGEVGLTTEDGVGSVTVGDIVVKEGKISFGQVGSLVETHEYTYEQEDFGGEGKDVDAAIRYNVMEGFDVQLEGAQQDGVGDDYGLGAKYAGESGAVSYVADAQVRLSDTVAATLDDATPFMYFGAGVTYTADIVTVKAGFNNYSVVDARAAYTALNATSGDSDSEYAVSVTATPVDNLTVGAHYMDKSTETDDDSRYKVEGSFAADAVTVSGYYTAVLVEDAIAEMNGKVEYAADMIAAYAGVTLNEGMVEHDAALIEAGVSYTTESGIVYAGDYTQGDSTDGVDQNNIVFSAMYSF
ncbi:MAG: hypothetical protein ACI9DO_000437 [Reinekea sp.]